MQTPAEEQKSTRELLSNFIKIPDLDKLKKQEGTTNKQEELLEIEVIDPPAEKEISIVEIGVPNTKIIMSVESGIKDVLKMIKEDKSNKLKSMTSVIVHYLIKGFENEYNIRMSAKPKSLDYADAKPKTTKEKIKSGGTGLSRKDKNILIQQTSVMYYQDALEQNLITREEMHEKIRIANDKIYEYGQEGVFISPNKTKGVSLFDSKVEVRYDREIPDDRWKDYSLEDIVIKVPHFENLSAFDIDSNIRYKREIQKVSEELLDNKGSVFFKFITEPYKNMDSVARQMQQTLTEYMGKLSETHTFVGAHIIQINKTGNTGSLRKNRYLALDFASNDSHQPTWVYTDFKNTCGIIEPLLKKTRFIGPKGAVQSLLDNKENT